MIRPFRCSRLPAVCLTGGGRFVTLLTGPYRAKGTMNNPIRKLCLTLGVAATLTATSCIGPNNAYNSVLNWNSKLSNKYVNELAFLGLHFIPVYQLCYFGDLILFNSVEFWSGKNMIAKPEAFKPQCEEAK